jgi:hypothetical protein
VLSMYVGAEDILVTFDVHFAPEVPAADVAATIKRIEHAVRERYPKVRRIFLEPVGLAPA